MNQITEQPPVQKKPKLLDQAYDLWVIWYILRAKHYSMKTEEAYVHISYNETDLQRKVKSFGGKWNRDKQVWELAYKYVVELGLSDRLISDKKNVQY